jgi:hypothetical protein
MRNRARRLLSNMTGRGVRRAQLMLCAGLAFSPMIAVAETIEAARFTESTSRYTHGVLGDSEEWGALEISTTKPNGGLISLPAVLKRTTYTIRLPISSVFEDVAPRLADVDGDGKPEVIVVETDVHLGASLAIYTTKGKLAATPYIGQSHRWLAPVAIADLDGDGLVELAYVDRPHLTKTLRVWRFENGELTQVAALEGVSNHRIGERDIAGGLRNCANGPEMIVARADWQRLLAVTFDGTALKTREIGPHRGRASFTDALACK